MCHKRNSVTLKIGNKKVKLDRCLRSTIKFLNDNGYETVMCCCGHGIYPTTILVKYSYDVFEMISGVLFPSSKKRFYKKDENGYYYLPR